MSVQSPKEGFFRRNGKPQSCEPCRKSKVRCDHTYPTCLRCRSRNAGASCVYHPAPLTRPRSQYRRWKSDATPPSTLDNHVTPPDAVLESDLDRLDALSGTTPDSNPSAHTPNQLNGSEYQTYRIEDTPYSGFEKPYHDQRLSIRSSSIATPPPPNAAAFRPNFLGSTSYSSVFAHSWKNGAAGSVRPWQVPLTDMDNVEDQALDVDRVNVGAQLLEQFSRIQHLELAIKRFYKVRDFVFIPETLVLNSVGSIKATLHGQSHSNSHLQNLSKAVFINTSKEFDFSTCKSPKTIHEMLTGPYLRWEIIGIIFTLVALSSQSYSEEGGSRGEFGDSLGRQDFTLEMAKASETCLAFCVGNENLNDLVAWYQYESLLLQATLHGDTSNFSWKRLGDLATTIYALGIHHEIDAEADVSCFFKESRKKCFGASYTLDKAIATLLGRPPRISRQYATQTIPLNLSDEETMAEAEALPQILSKLDVHGWNTDGVVRCCSWIRVRTQVAFIREEVLQLSLGRPSSDIEARAIDTLHRSKMMWDSIPPLMKYNNDCWGTRKSAKECYMLLIVYLEHLYSSFLLHRILAKYTQSDSSELYDSAWDLLSATLTLCRERDRLMKIQYQLSWTIVYNGLPSAGLLALELLRKQQQTAYQSCLLIPRAELIRSLSVFTDSLEWVARPGHGNHKLCVAARNVLTQILDAVLDPQGYGGGGGHSSAVSEIASDSVSDITGGGFANMGTVEYINDFSEKLMMMEAGIPSAGTIDWDAWISS